MAPAMSQYSTHPNDLHQMTQYDHLVSQSQQYSGGYHTPSNFQHPSLSGQHFSSALHFHQGNCTNI